MKRTLFILMIVLTLSALVLAACGGGAKQETNSEDVAPAEYKGKTNPVNGQADAVAAGKKIYDTNCTSCHGAGGKGDGPAGAALKPAPEDLVAASGDSADDWFYYRIAEGGAVAPFNSAMPAWKGVLKENEIWQVISYIRTLK